MVYDAAVGGLTGVSQPRTGIATGVMRRAAHGVAEFVDHAGR